MLSTCAITVPDPAVAPVTPDCETVHENVVVPGFPLSVTDAVLPEQMACEVGEAVSVGVVAEATVIVCVIGEQPFVLSLTETV